MQHMDYDASNNKKKFCFQYVQKGRHVVGYILNGFISSRTLIFLIRINISISFVLENRWLLSYVKRFRESVIAVLRQVF